MNAIIPYSVGALARKSLIQPLGNPTVRKVLFSTAGKLGNMAMRTAARRIQRAWRKRRGGRAGYRTAKRRRISRIKKGNIGRQARTKMGDHVASSNCKRALIDNVNPTARDTRILYLNSLLTLPLGQGINERERSIINCRGIKLWHRWANTTNSEMTVNVAVISNRWSTVDNPNSTDFFRAYQDRRAQDFDPTAMTGLNFHFSHINTDRYLVHWHRRYILAPSDNDPSMNNKNSRVIIKKYIKINRQIRYEDVPDGNSNEPINTNLYLVWWADRFDASAGDLSAVGEVNHAAQSVLYFRESGAF